MPWEDSREFEFVYRTRQKVRVSTKSGSPGGDHTTVSIDWWELDRDGYGKKHHGVDIPADIFEKIIQFVRDEEPEAEPTLAQKVDELMQRHNNGFIGDDELKRGIAELSKTAPSEPE
ncbi:hypothetical protein [Glycomyces sp. NPDC021274]|uniref:hypothetical protein n=1 Tax=Glycomyces sp. NPDC021274 TaxID=3155120 RepID=UPI0033EB32F1